MSFCSCINLNWSCSGPSLLKTCHCPGYARNRTPSDGMQHNQSKLKDANYQTSSCMHSYIKERVPGLRPLKFLM